MFKVSLSVLTLFTLAFFFSTSLSAQQVREPTFSDKEWTKPYPPFRIAGNLYYVGTYELACYLLSTDKGLILINTGTAASASLIKKSVEKLGFRFSDIKILLTTQVHYDHVGAMAAIKKETGAKMMVDAADANVLADGGESDYEFGGKGALFQPVVSDRKLHNGDTIALGTMKLVMLHHPGHTKGSCSFLFDVKDSLKTYRILIANMPSMVVDEPFQKVTKYPEIEKDYAYTFKTMKALSFDIWLASHASQFDLHLKHKPGDTYNPSAFFDRLGYDNELRELELKYQQKRKKK